MTFHGGGENKTNQARRAVNHMYNIPFFKQQINLPNNLKASNFSDEEKEILGFKYMEPLSVEQYLASR